MYYNVNIQIKSDSKYWACNHTGDYEYEDVSYSCDHSFTMCDHCHKSYPRCPLGDDGVRSEHQSPWSEDPANANGATPKSFTTFFPASKDIVTAPRSD